MTQPHFLGLDIGTSGVKAVLIDAARQMVAESHAALSAARPQPLWSEQDAEDYWWAVRAALSDLRNSAPDAYGATTAIGLSGQMHGAVTLGKDDRPLRPVILWNDGRCHAEAEAFYAAHRPLVETLGVMPMPGFTLPKLLWLQRHEPALFAALDCVLLPKDYVRLKLTGERITDMSDAAGTLYFDQARRDWSDAALAAIGLDRARMPALVEGSAPGGRLRADMAADLGLSPAVIVAGGGGDAATGGVGIGAIEEGRRFISLGTSAQYFVARNAYRPNIERLVHAFAHAVPNRWYQMGAMLNGASAFGWAAKMLGRAPADLSAEVEARYDGPAPLVMLPYLSGERTPHNDPHARGALIGLTPDTDAVHIAQAAMEGVAFSLADAAAALADHGDEPISLIGGGARSAIWAQIIANVLGRPVQRHHGADTGPAFGAALLAIMAAEGGDPVAIAEAPPVEDVFAPDPRWSTAYTARQATFRALYASLKPCFPALDLDA